MAIKHSGWMTTIMNVPGAKNIGIAISGINSNLINDQNEKTKSQLKKNIAVEVISIIHGLDLRKIRLPGLILMNSEKCKTVRKTNVN